VGALRPPASASRISRCWARHFYRTLTERSPENGLLGRCLVLEVGGRGEPGEPPSIRCHSKTPVSWQVAAVSTVRIPRAPHRQKALRHLTARGCAQKPVKRGDLLNDRETFQSDVIDTLTEPNKSLSRRKEIAKPSQTGRARTPAAPKQCAPSGSALASLPCDLRPRRNNADLQDSAEIWLRRGRSPHPTARASQLPRRVTTDTRPTTRTDCERCRPEDSPCQSHHTNKPRRNDPTGLGISNETETRHVNCSRVCHPARFLRPLRRHGHYKRPPYPDRAKP